MKLTGFDSDIRLDYDLDNDIERAKAENEVKGRIERLIKALEELGLTGPMFDLENAVTKF